MPFGSLVPGFTPMPTQQIQNTGLGSAGMKILQQARTMGGQNQPGLLFGGGQPGQPGAPGQMGLLARLFPGMMGQQPQQGPGTPLNIAPPGVIDPAAPIAGLY
jgi:hypothetical protein